MSCSLGAIPGASSCRMETLFGKEKFNKEEWLLLKIRSGLTKIKNVCEAHKLKFLSLYESKQRTCCNPLPLKRHERAVSSDLKTISKEMYLQSVAMPKIEGSLSVVIPGKKLCKRCYPQVMKFLNVVKEWREPSSSSESDSVLVSQDLFDDIGTGTAESLQTAVVSDKEVINSSLVQCDILNEDAVNIQPDSEDGDPGSAPADIDVINLEICSRLRPTRSTVYKESSSTQTSTSTVNNEDNVEPSGSVYDPVSKSEQAINLINESLQQIGESPVTKRKLLESKSYAPAKLKKIEDQFAFFMAAGGASNVKEDSFETKVMDALLNKFLTSTGAAEKILVLSVALSALQHRKVLEIFGPHGATDYLIKKTSSLMAEQGGLFPSPLPKRGRALSEETIKLVDAFYNSDKVTYQLPGKKDCIIMKVNGEKVPVPKKLILCGLRELFELFQEENPLVKISFSKFASLRPRHCVLAGSAGTHTVCVCCYHQNFKLMIEGGNMKDFKYQTDSAFIEAVLCDNPTSDCYLQSGCPNCPDMNLLKGSLQKFYEENFVEEVTYNRWNEKQRSSLDTIVKPVEDFVDLFISSLKKLLPHHYIAKKQAEHLECAKKNLKEGEVLTICDFSENYSFLIQDSVQSFYWSNDQATVFPFGIYYLENGVLKFIGFIVISDHMKHNVQAFYAFQKKFIDFIRTVVPKVHKVIYCSDGAAQQFKNMYNMMNQTYHMEDFQIESEWHFFASYHGKGPSDGLGGAFKCSAARASIRLVLIRNPRELYEWGISRTNSSIRLDYVSTEEVEQVTSFLKSRFERGLNINGIRSLHCCIPKSVGELWVKRTSLSEKSHFRYVELIRNIPDWSSLEPGDNITSLSKKHWQIAQISNKDEDTKEELLVVVLKRCQKAGLPRTYFYTMPEREEEVSIPMSDVLTKVNPLYNANHKSFTLSDNDQEQTVWQFKSVSA